MIELRKLLKDIIRFLDSIKGKDKIKGYCLIGGMGIGARGFPRATKDIDLLIDADEDFFQEYFPKELKKEEYLIKIYRGSIDDPLRNLIRILDEKENVLADLILIYWNWQREIVDSAEPIKLESNLVIPVARAEDLIVLKLKAASPRDLLDAEELMKTMVLNKGWDKNRLYLLAQRAKVDKRLNLLLSKLKIK